MSKTVLITGATGNLGQAVVDRFIQEGFQVSVSVSPGKKAAARFGKGVAVFEADLSVEKESEKLVSSVIAQSGSIDAALLLAGGFAAGKIEKTDEAVLRKMFALNFETAYYVARPAFEHMKARKSGQIVLVGARPALLAKDGKNMVAYALSKSLLFKLAELLNAEGSSSNVITSVIVPSTIDTPANRESMPDKNFSDWVTPSEIASAIAFLCSGENKSLREPVLKMYGNS
jgi:NAD(P)-dependent dehydrogenase (short-subunit alcohol dehydrogenase family)